MTLHKALIFIQFPYLNVDTGKTSFFFLVPCVAEVFKFIVMALMEKMSQATKLLKIRHTVNIFLYNIYMCTYLSFILCRATALSVI